MEIPDYLCVCGGGILQPQKNKLFKPFIVLHIAIIAAAFFMGTTDAERFSYFLIAALIAGYSIRLKTITLQKNDLSNTPLSDDADGLVGGTA